MDNSFFSHLDESSSSTQESGSSYFSHLDERDRKKQSLSEAFKQFSTRKPLKIDRDLRAQALDIGTGVAGIPGDLASLIVGENPLTSESLRGKAFEAFPSLAPKSPQEKEFDEGLSLVSSLFTPGSAFRGAAKLLGKGISKLGGSAASKALKGKYQQLYEIGKNLGIDEKALAPFRHGKVTGTFLKQIASLGEDAKKGVKFAEDLATPFYEKLNEVGGKIPLNSISNRSVVKGFENIISDIQKSPALVKESKDVVNFLEEAALNLRNNPNYTVEGLMDLHKQLNKSVNWSSLSKSGKKHLVNEAKETVMKGILGMSPKLGREFSDMNKLYAGYKNLAKEVKPYKLLQYASKGGPLGYALISALTGKDFAESLQTGTTVYFGKKALGKIGAKMLTDPKWVGLKEKIFHSIKNGSTTTIPKLLQAIVKKSEMERIDPFEED